MAISLALFSGCGTLSYLFQAGRGQLSLLNRARPMKEVLNNERTPPRTKKLLSEIPSIKSYGEKYGLKATKNYTEYAKLDGPAATWVVSACEPLEFKSRVWSFPIVGSFNYLGWFDQDAAIRYSEKLKEEGLDVDVRGARAFSTLGWFRDPVVSTMISEGHEALGELVNVVIHESVHATYYLKGQSYFNETLASFIADQLTPVYLTEKYGSSGLELKTYLEGEKESEKRTRTLHQAYATLEKLYQSTLPREEKLTQKKVILDRVSSELGFKRPLNNATLIQFRTYRVGEEDYQALFKACQGDWGKIWSAIRTIHEDQFAHEHDEDLSPVLARAQKACL